MATAARRYRATIVLSVLVLGGVTAVVWSKRQVPDSVREERQNSLLPTLRRDRITRIEITGPSGRFELTKANGRWTLTNRGRRYDADDTEVERMLTEAEFSNPSRRLGSLDRASRERFGLTTPRANVVLYEGTQATARFAVGGQVADEENAYVDVGGAGYVIAKSLADAFAQAPWDLRDRTLANAESSRVSRIELDGAAGRRVLERRAGTWRLVQPAEGRATRARVESILSDLRELRATRYLAEDVDDAGLARYGLAQPRVTVRAVLDGGRPPIAFRFGGPCESRDNEVTVVREGSRAVACVGRSVVEDLSHAADGLRDSRLLWARTDEVDRVRVHTPTAEFTVRRERDVWRLEGLAGDTDPDAVESWITALGNLNAETRMGAEALALHALAPPVFWIDVTRTGVDGTERINIGVADADRMYVSRDDESIVLGCEPSSSETLRVDPIRFRGRHIIRDVADELTGLVTEASTFRDEVTKSDGTWRMLRPFAALADPASIRTAAQRIATFDAERWVASGVLATHGLAAPRLRVVARFEGAGPEPEGDAGRADAGRPRVREYTLTFGASAPGGGVYARWSGRDGVFVVSQTAFDELHEHHVDRNVLEVDRADVRSLEITRRSATGIVERIVVQRDGELWRTAQGAPAERSRVNVLLGRLALVRAQSVVGYGPAPADARLGDMTLTLIVAAAEPSSDAGAHPATTHAIRVELGATFGSGSDAAVYARRDGIDATVSVPRDIAESLRTFTP